MNRIQRLREVFREAYRNVATGTARPLIALFAFALVVGAAGFAQARGVVGVAQDALTWQQQGSAVQIITFENQIDGRQCDALASLPGIGAAGAVRQIDSVRLAALPSVPISTFEVTPGLGELLGVTAGPGQEIGGVWLSEDLARVIGITDTELPLVIQNVEGAGRWAHGGTFGVAGVYSSPAGGQSSPLDYAVLSPAAPVGSFDSCWALLWPESSQTISLLPLSVEVTSTAPGEHRQTPRLAQLNTTAGTSFDAAGRLDALPTWPLTVAAVGFAAVLGFGLTYTRKLELASALHAGVRKPSLLIQLGIEALYWLIPAVALVIPAAFWAAARENPDPTWIAFYPALRTTALAVLAALLTVLIAALLVREKHLFRHFKQR
ncbi:MAG: hypothetical protein FWD83_06965 [Promicromonosporaceae bacterium]|nr:hypothetical protein [Promicromonosporaceae bacterium]